MSTPAITKILIIYIVCFLSIFSESLAKTIVTKTSKRFIPIEIDGCAAIMNVSASTNGISIINTTILHEKKLIKIPIPILTTDYNSIAENLVKCVAWSINCKLHKLNVKKELNTYKLKNEDGDYISMKILFESSDEGKISHTILEYKCSTINGSYSTSLTPSQTYKLAYLIKEIPALEAAAKKEAKKADELLK